MSYFITNSVTKRRLSYKKLSHPSDSPLPPRGHRPPPSGRADAGGARSAQRGRSRRGRAAALRTCRRRHRRRCRWIGSSYPPHGKGRCPHRLTAFATSPASGGSCYAVIQSLLRYHGERSTSANHTSLSLVFLGHFPIRPVTQSASSCGLASWTGQQGGPRERWKGHKTGAVIRSLSLRQQPLPCIDFQRITDPRCLRFSRWRPTPQASCACRRGCRRRAPSSSHRRGAALPAPW